MFYHIKIIGSSLGLIILFFVLFMQFVPKLRHDIEMFELYGNLHGPSNVKNATLRMMKSKKELDSKQGKVNKKLLALSQGKSVRNLETSSSSRNINSSNNNNNTNDSRPSLNKRKSVKDLDAGKEPLKSPNSNNNTSQLQSPREEGGGEGEEIEKSPDKSFLAQLGKSMKNITGIMSNDNNDDKNIQSSTSTATTPIQSPAQSPRPKPSKSITSKQFVMSKSSKALTESRSRSNVGNIVNDKVDEKKENENNKSEDDGVLTPEQLKHKKWIKKILWCMIFIM